MNKIAKEIPAFLHYLQHEYKPLEKQSRLWLNIEDIVESKNLNFLER